MEPELTTRHSHVLPSLRSSLGLLYVGRLLVGMNLTATDEPLELIDAYIESVTDDLAATELLHEAAVLAGDVLPPSDVV